MSTPTRDDRPGCIDRGCSPMTGTCCAWLLGQKMGRKGGIPCPCGITLCTPSAGRDLRHHPNQFYPKRQPTRWHSGNEPAPPDWRSRTKRGLYFSVRNPSISLFPRSSPFRLLAMAASTRLLRVGFPPSPPGNQRISPMNQRFVSASAALAMMCLVSGSSAVMADGPAAAPATPTSAPAAPVAAAPMPMVKVDQSKKPPFADVIKEAKPVEGLMNTYKKDEQVLLDVSPANLNKDFIVVISIAHGIGEGQLLG